MEVESYVLQWVTGDKEKNNSEGKIKMVNA